MRYNVVVPSTADGSLSVTIGRWLKKIGDPVKRGDDLVEGSTEKITLYVTSPADGTLAEIQAETGKRVNVGDVVGVVEGEAG